MLEVELRILVVAREDLDVSDETVGGFRQGFYEVFKAVRSECRRLVLMKLGYRQACRQL